MAHAGMDAIRRDRHDVGGRCAVVSPAGVRGSYPIGVTDDLSLIVSGRLAAWLQPRDQRFTATDSDAGGLVGLRLAVPIHGVEAYADVQLKTAGWVTSEPNLASGVTTLAGLAMPLFR